MLKNFLILFGILDLISLLRTYKNGLKLIGIILNPETLSFYRIIDIFEVILIASLLITGILSILKRKSSLVGFYIQFPFKLAFMILSFGFLLKVFGIPYDSIIYKFLVFIVITLEIARLIITITINRRNYKPE